VAYKLSMEMFRFQGTWVSLLFHDGWKRGDILSGVLVFLSPLRGLLWILRITHDLRRGLHSYAASRLDPRFQLELVKLRA
jgi:hypothetical protein